MKTRILLFAILPVLYVSQVFAQGSTAGCATLQSIKNIDGPLYHNHSAALSKYLLRTTGTTGSRITGETDLTNNGAMFVYSDSIILHYSGTRGGDLNHLGLQLKFDNATIYEYNTTSSNWVNGTYEFQTFDASDNILSTVVQTWNATASAWVNSAEELYTYAGNNVQMAIYQTWDTTSSMWVNQEKDIYTYDGSNNMLTDVYFTWDIPSSAWVNADQYTYTYNSNNKVTSEISQSWDNVGLVWDNESKQVYTYDVTNTYMLTATSQGWNSGASTWDDVDQDVYTYDGMNDKLTDLYQEWTGTAWLNSSLNTYSNFVAQLPQTQIYQTWNTTTLAFDNATKYMLTYNSDNELTDEVSQTWNIGGFWQSTTNDRDSRFYYESYTTGIKSVANGGNANIYPVPANDALTINLNWDVPQPFTISIYDIQGMAVRQWDVPACAQYQTDIALNDFATGNYFMKIIGTNGSMQQRFVVVK